METYRAIRLEGKGTVDQLVPVDLPVVQPGPGQVSVVLEACGVGATDIVMRTGTYPYAPPFPFVPGYDVVGVVDAVGPGVTRFAPGDRVGGLVVTGGYAERIVRDAEDFVPVPRDLDAAIVVALILNYVTAWQMLHRVAHLCHGDAALVLGASGGVGSALLELARDSGVTAFGAGSPAKRAGIEAFGAVFVDSRGERSIEAQVRDRADAGVDAAFDPLSGRFAGSCVRSVRRGGRLVWYGFSAVTRGDGSTDLVGLARGAASTFVAGPLLLRRPTFYGITRWYRKDRGPFRDDLAACIALLAAGRISPRIDARIGLDGVRDAQVRLERGDVAGKIVVTYGPRVTSGGRRTACSTP